MPAPPLNPRELITRLKGAGAEFTVIGGMAVVGHGHFYTTEDLDVCAPLTPTNLTKIITALSGLNPRQRMHPHRPPLPENLAQMTGLRNLYVETTLGWIDFLSEVPGVGPYERLASRAITMQIAGNPCKIICLEDLIAAKRTAGRPKDLLVLPSLLALQQLQSSDFPNPNSQK